MEGDMDGAEEEEETEGGRKGRMGRLRGTGAGDCADARDGEAGAETSRTGGSPATGHNSARSKASLMAFSRASLGVNGDMTGREKKQKEIEGGGESVMRHQGQNM
jgi:hypothetical protein